MVKLAPALEDIVRSARSCQMGEEDDMLLHTFPGLLTIWEISTRLSDVQGRSCKAPRIALAHDNVGSARYLVGYRDSATEWMVRYGMEGV